MPRSISILLNEHFEKFIFNKISSGKYNSLTDVVRAALKLLEAEESKMKAFNKALSKGEKSGFVKNFNPKKHLRSMRGNVSLRRVGR